MQLFLKKVLHYLILSIIIALVQQTPEQNLAFGLVKRRRKMSRPQTTRKFEIIKTATEFIFSVGYSNTSPQMIAKKMNMSTGNITHYFPSKEHLLCTIVEMLCEFQ